MGPPDATGKAEKPWRQEQNYGLDNVEHEVCPVGDQLGDTEFVAGRQTHQKCQNPQDLRYVLHRGAVSEADDVRCDQQNDAYNVVDDGMGPRTDHLIPLLATASMAGSSVCATSRRQSGSSKLACPSMFHSED